MAGVARTGDKTRGHKTDPKVRVLGKGSTSVRVKGRPAVRVGDSVKPTPGRVAKGNPRVLVNGRPVARKGDRISDGAKIVKGSRSVRA